MKDRFAKKFWRSMISGVVYQLAVFAVALLVGTLLAQLLGLALEESSKAAFSLAAWIVAALLGSAGPLFLLNRWRLRRKELDAQSCREWLLAKLLEHQLPIATQGELEVKFRRDGDAVVQFFGSAIPAAIGGGLIWAGAGLLLCRVHMGVGLLFLLLNLVQLLPIFVYESWTKKIHSETCQAEEETSSWILEGFAGAHILKSYQAKDWYLKKFRTLDNQVMHWGFRAEGAATAEDVVFTAIDSLLNYGSYLILGLFVLFGGLSPAQLPLAIILSGYLFSSIRSIFDLWLQWVQYRAARERLGLQTPRERAAQGSRVLSCQNLRKAYGDREILSGLSFSVEEGQRIALRGKNGSGKSTLLRILLELEMPDEGEVACSLPRCQISYALQEEAKTQLTISQLVEELEKNPQIDGTALREHLAQFSMEDALAQPLCQLSGGQLKRFFLSAALAKNSRLLILDEPGNHLDSESLAYLSQNLERYPGTLVVCTHMELPGVTWTRVAEMEGGTLHG